MKPSFYTQTLIALAVAVAAATVSISQAQDQSTASPPTLPPEIAPDTPLAQVVKLVQSGVDISVINNYIANSPGAFNLDADKIITLKDLGVPTDVINSMLGRDKSVYAATATPPPAAAPAPAPDTTTTDTAPPTAPVTVEYFNDNLNPYGSWVVVEGYGRCWRPTVVNYDGGWRPYCDRGHWVYTDCGWYWDSDYAWGSTFHYGRWFHHDRFGWCWYPDTNWGPSWVTWRSSGEYCGWAPLPPRSEFRPGVGFFFEGATVSAGFDFGLRADCFTFVSPDHFCEHHPRRFCVEPSRVTVVYNNTTVINNFDSHNRVVVNNGIPVSRVRTPDHRPVQTVQVNALPNARRQGWRGEEAARSDHQAGNAGNSNSQFNHAPAAHNGVNNGQAHSGQGAPANGNNNNAGHRQDAGTTGQPRTINQQATGNQDSHNGQHDRTAPNNNSGQSTPSAGQPHGNNGAKNTGNNFQNQVAGQAQGNNGVTAAHVKGLPSGKETFHSQSVTPAANTAVPAHNFGQPATDIHSPPVNNSRPAREQSPPPFQQQSEQRQFAAPSQPAVIQPREQHVEQREQRAEAPSQRQQGNQDRGSDQDKGKQNH